MPVSSFSFVRRFLELFELAQYEDAALIAARAPRGVLRNIDTMEMFKGGNSTCTVIRALIMLISSKDEISLTKALKQSQRLNLTTKGRDTPVSAAEVEVIVL